MDPVTMSSHLFQSNEATENQTNSSWNSLQSTS